MSLKFHWVYLALAIIVITSCSKEKASKSSDDYTLATYDLRQKGNTLVSGQNATVKLLEDYQTDKRSLNKLLMLYRGRGKLHYKQ